MKEYVDVVNVTDWDIDEFLDDGWEIIEIHEFLDGTRIWELGYVRQED